MSVRLIVNGCGGQLSDRSGLDQIYQRHHGVAEKDNSFWSVTPSNSRRRNLNIELMLKGCNCEVRRPGLPQVWLMFGVSEFMLRGAAFRTRLG